MTAEQGGGGTKACPFCAETIKAAAVVCRHCGRDLARGASSPVRVREAGGWRGVSLAGFLFWATGAVLFFVGGTWAAVGAVLFVIGVVLSVVGRFQR